MSAKNMSICLIRTRFLSLGGLLCDIDLKGQFNTSSISAGFSTSGVRSIRIEKPNHLIKVIKFKTRDKIYFL